MVGHVDAGAVGQHVQREGPHADRDPGGELRGRRVEHTDLVHRAVVGVDAHVGARAVRGEGDELRAAVRHRDPAGDDVADGVEDGHRAGGPAGDVGVGPVGGDLHVARGGADRHGGDDGRDGGAGGDRGCRGWRHGGRCCTRDERERRRHTPDDDEHHGEQGDKPAPTARRGLAGHRAVAGRGVDGGPVLGGSAVGGSAVGGSAWAGRPWAGSSTGGAVTGKGSVNSGAEYPRPRRVGVPAQCRGVGETGRPSRCRSRPGGRCLGGRWRHEVPLHRRLRWFRGVFRFCGVRFPTSVGFFGGSRRGGGDRGAPEPARHALGLLVRGRFVGGGTCVEVLGRDEQLLVTRATPLGGLGRPGYVGGLALTVGFVRRLRPGVVRRGLADRVPPVRDDAGRLDPLVVPAVDRLGGVFLDS